MPGGKSPGPSIKKPDEYEALKEQGYSKSKAAAISNEAAKGPAARSKMAKKAAATREEEVMAAKKEAFGGKQAAPFGKGKKEQESAKEKAKPATKKASK